MNMQQDEDGSNPNPITNGLVLPPNLGFGEVMNKFVCASSDELYGLQAAASFSSFPSISASRGVRGTDRLMEGIPLPYPSIATFPSQRSISNANQENGVAIHGFSPTFDTMLHQARSCYPREWTMIEHAGLNPNTRNELSLTSSSVHDRSSGATCYSSSFNSRPLLGTRFLEAMQEILAEIACFALENAEGGATFSYSSSIDPSNGAAGLNRAPVFRKQETTNAEANKKYLLALLQMVDDQYSQCLDEIHTVTSAFHAVTELDPNLHMRFALPTLSLMYKSLRERISSHILAHHKERPQARESNSLEACFIQKQWALQQLSKRENQLWRPQRGLPETSVSVLRTWMFQNFLHPYPKDSEKHFLALKSGLTRNQVSNWFINARVRLWKPMIEEMCAEMNRKKGGKGDEESMGIESRRFKRG